MIHWCIGYAYALLDRLADASRHASVLRDMGPDVPYTRHLLAMIDGLEGRRESALERVAALDVARLDHHHLFRLGESFILSGEHGRGLNLLERSIPGFYNYLYLRSTAGSWIPCARRHASRRS